MYVGFEFVYIYVCCFIFLDSFEIIVVFERIMIDDWIELVRGLW